MLDDAPFTDPAIREDYERALGKFILAFNEVDYWLSQLIAHELEARDRSDIIKRDAVGPFAERLNRLELLATGAKQNKLSSIPFDRLREIASERNHLAHGHMDQNPYDRSYEIVMKQKARHYPASRMLTLADELLTAASNLRISCWFQAVVDEGT
jgi:hypothetical protein